MYFKYMNKEAWLLDQGVLYKGVIKIKWFNHVFIPNNCKEKFYCYKIVTKKILAKYFLRMIYILFTQD